jgi:multiple sugar transport system permease protein
MAMSLAVAMLLNKNIYIRNVLRTTFILPLIAPTASVVLIWQVVFNFHGSMNSLLSFAGVQPIDWMNSQWTRLVVVAFYLWKNIGYNMILFLAALQNIPSEYYEAAMLDGAGPVRRFINITAILLTPTTFFVLIISIINSFKVFREIYLISGNYPYESIYMLQHYMNNMFMSLDYQKLSAAAVMMALVIAAIVLILFRIEKKIGKYI